MSAAIKGLTRVTCPIDDIQSSQKEHTEYLIAVLLQLEKFHVTPTKRSVCLQSSVKFAGHVIDKEGIKSDPENIKAIQDMKEPKSLSDHK